MRSKKLQPTHKVFLWCRRDYDSPRQVVFHEELVQDYEVTEPPLNGCVGSRLALGLVLSKLK